jgi:hypothetical protein
MFQYASTLVNQRVCFYLLLLVSLRLAFSNCVTALFYLVCFEVSHRLNAFVIQTKLN